jgi:hypothetical protein
MSSIEHESVQANGIWAGVILFRCPWAHPLWSDYVLSVCDLDSPGKKPPIKRDPTATHELLLYALDPEYPVDFSAPITRRYQPLQPANHGYQFRAGSNQAAWSRAKALVDDCLSRRLSPDTDYRSMWDARMADGWSLLKGARR